MTVTEIILEVCETMCDKYCKYRELCNENMENKHCDDCPLNKLQ